MISTFLFIAGGFALGSAVIMIGVDLIQDRRISYQPVGLLAISVISFILAIIKGT